MTAAAGSQPQPSDSRTALAARDQIIGGGSDVLAALGFHLVYERP